MSRTFNFNDLTQYTLETKLGGPDNTVLHVTTPPERLIEQMAAAQGEIDALTKGTGDIAAQSRLSYELAAKLISCNTEGVTVTVEDLRGKYGIYPAALAMYLTAYMEFINDFHKAKN